VQGIHKDEGTKTKCNSYVIGKSQQGVEGEADIFGWLAKTIGQKWVAWSHN